MRRGWANSWRSLYSAKGVKRTVVGDGGGEDVHGEVELWRGKLSHCLDEDIRDHLVLDPVRVELVSSKDQHLVVHITALRSRIFD